MDFAKALILWLTTDHYIAKLQWYGIQGKIHQWISNFLTNRRQKVILGDARPFFISKCILWRPPGNSTWSNTFSCLHQ